MEKPMIPCESGGFKEQVSIIQSIIMQFFCFLAISSKRKPTIWDLLLWKVTFNDLPPSIKIISNMISSKREKLKD